MYKSVKILKEASETHKFCDVCGKEINMGLACSVAKCMYCGIDLCETCVGHEDETPGDYREVYCKKCWDLGEQYRPIIEELNAKIEALYNEWRSKCKDLS